VVLFFVILFDLVYIFFFLFGNQRSAIWWIDSSNHNDIVVKY
jgi:hypothetical protein